MEAALRLKLNEDLKQSLRDRDAIKTSTIRLLLSAIKYAEIAKQTEMTDGDILVVVAKEIKQRHESIEAYKQGNRADLVQREETELNILKAYMPQQMTHEEIVAEARQIIAETGAKGIGDKGKVMPKIVAKLKGKADGREINNVVTELLSAQ